MNFISPYIQTKPQCAGDDGVAYGFEFMKHSDGTKLEGPPLELYHNAERWLLEHLSEII